MRQLFHFSMAKLYVVLGLLIFGMVWGQENAVKNKIVRNEFHSVTIIIMVRHAEKEEGEDPPLSKEGKFRALQLRDALKASGISAIYCPDLKRNRQTAQPLADLFDIELTLISEDLYAQPKKMAHHVVNDILDSHTGKVVLYIGNQTQYLKHEGCDLHEMYWCLGGEGINQTRYQDMYIFIVGTGSTKIIHAFYGDVN